ncbi:MAG TPA: hypothetical protein VHD33_04725 [Legionellaceae bacterium]|nr:hypothetical protein [Legionellaceae bacterium]
MGGFGSGRHGATKLTTNSYRRMDVHRWQRDKLFTPNNSFSWQWVSEGKVISYIRVDVAADLNYVTLRYKNKKRDREWKSFDYNIHLAWDDCHLGGRRPWFICPVKICNRRVAILYGGSVFACRHCYNLAYKSQRESACDQHEDFVDVVWREARRRFGININDFI